ncbi:MAG: carboxymuconolactone decarboxylase family protein, partial [Acidobacteriota bacterium]
AAVTDADFAELRRHFDEVQIIELVGVVALFGFLNRWNATLATELEGPPRAFAEERLAPFGWDPGQHTADSGQTED